MLHASPCGSAAAIVLLLATTAHAQPAGPAGRPDPLNARAEVPPTAHRSALGAYRPAHEVAVGSWKEANDLVTRIGGWRVYLREATQPEPAAPALPASGPGRPAQP